MPREGGAPSNLDGATEARSRRLDRPPARAMTPERLHDRLRRYQSCHTDLPQRWRRRSRLGDTSLNVRRGEFAAVVGPSGCGKSSLMKLVTGLVLPDSGDIVLFGDRVRGPV